MTSNAYLYFPRTCCSGPSRLAPHTPGSGADVHEYCLLQTIAEGDTKNGGGYVKLAFKLSAGGPAIGLAFALCLAALLRWVGGNILADLGMTVVSAYGSSMWQTFWVVLISWLQLHWGCLWPHMAARRSVRN